MRHDLDLVHIVLHGGEPLLAGHDRLAEVISTLRASLIPVCDVDLRIHTNGVTLDERFCDLFEAHHVKVGVSIDGDRAANDRHRLFAGKRSSYDRVIRAIDLLRARPRLYAGLLCTIDVANDPIDVYESLLALDPPRIDFLLPHATHDAPPPSWKPASTTYADWLIKIFDRWHADGYPVGVRLFDSIIRTGHGEASLTEAIGLDPSTLVVIEVDGTYEQVDSLKVAFDGAAGTGYDVERHPLDEVAAHPGVLARQRGVDGLSLLCRQCPVVTGCGGGLYPHRFKAGSFDNPSVYCADLYELISHVWGKMRQPSSHTLPMSSLDSLAGGRGGSREVRQLAGAEASIHRALVVAVGRRAPAVWDDAVEIDGKHPDAFADVLAHPFVRVWALSCMNGDGRPGYLANVVAAAMVRAHEDVKMHVEAIGGSVHLPTVGTFDGAGDGPVLLVADADGIRVDGIPASAWRPARHLTSGDVTILLEDSDPYRDCFQWGSSGRLTASEADDWQSAFEHAWRLIESDYPDYAAGLRSGLSAIVPLAVPTPVRQVSSTARDAFGVVAAALPDDPASLALLIMHEFQHVKLGALLDLFDLFDASDGTLYHAPWRKDPRPFEGLLQGTYAHIAVSDFWRLRRHRLRGSERAAAQEQFVRWHGHTSDAVRTLAESGRLTPLGRHFVTRMGETLAPWTNEQDLAGGVSWG